MYFGLRYAFWSCLWTRLLSYCGHLFLSLVVYSFACLYKETSHILDEYLSSILFLVFRVSKAHIENVGSTCECDLLQCKTDHSSSSSICYKHIGSVHHRHDLILHQYCIRYLNRQMLVDMSPLLSPTPTLHIARTISACYATAWQQPYANRSFRWVIRVLVRPGGTWGREASLGN